MVPKEVITPMKAVSALFGLLNLLLIFLTSRELYGERPALWATALAALSFDLIALSRLIYLDSIAIALILATVYSFVEYKKTKSSIYVAATIISLMLAMGARSPFPWLLALA